MSFQYVQRPRLPSDGESHPPPSRPDGDDEVPTGGDSATGAGGAVHLGATNGLTSSSNGSGAHARRRRKHKQFVPDVLKSGGGGGSGISGGSGPASFNVAEVDATFSGAGDVDRQFSDYGATRGKLLMEDPSGSSPEESA